MEAFFEIILDSLKKFSAEIIAGVLFAFCMWKFPKLQKWLLRYKKNDEQEKSEALNNELLRKLFEEFQQTQERFAAEQESERKRAEESQKRFEQIQQQIQIQLSEIRLKEEKLREQEKILDSASQTSENLYELSEVRAKLQETTRQAEKIIQQELKSQNENVNRQQIEFKRQERLAAQRQAAQERLQEKSGLRKYTLKQNNNNNNNDTGSEFFARKYEDEVQYEFDLEAQRESESESEFASASENQNQKASFGEKAASFIVFALITIIVAAILIINRDSWALALNLEFWGEHIIVVGLLIFAAIIVILPSSFKSPVAKLLKKAESGDPNAQYNLGVRYYNGDGLVQNYSEAVHWFRMSVSQKNVAAQNNLGICYYNGNGVEKNLERAAYWFRISAEHGNSIAQCNLANCYYNGEGVAQDFKLAYIWYCLSALFGHEKSSEIVENFTELSQLEKNDAQKQVLRKYDEIKHKKSS